MTDADFLNTLEDEIIAGLRAHFGADITVYRQFPDIAEIKFPTLILQQIGSGVEERYMGENLTFGGEQKRGELYGVAYYVHCITDNETSMEVNGNAHKKGKLLNFLMLNSANAINDLTFTNVEVVDRELQRWQDVGYIEQYDWWGASCIYIAVFKNVRNPT